MTKASEKKAATTNESITLPLFFRKPAVLDLSRHEQAGINPKQSFAFAKETNSIPLNVTEFFEAAKYYPIVFSSDETPAALAIVGLEKTNQFVNDKGDWHKGSYVPAYVRKYPFAFVEFADEKKMALCIDEESPHFMAKSDGKTSMRIYDEGKASQMAMGALEFCTAYHNQHLISEEFCKAMKAEGLLTANQSNIQFHDGRKLTLSGFMLIDEEKFNALSDKKILEFRKKNWLPIIYFALLSASNWKNLLELSAVQK